MAVIKGKSYTVLFHAWNRSDGTPKQGDASNITVRISKDGGPMSATSGSPSELDSTYAPGWYKVTLTDTEMNADSILVVPMSSTTGVVCQQILILTDKAYVPGVKTQTDKLTFSAGNYVYATAPDGVTLASSEHDAIQGDVASALVDVGYSSARAAKLDNLDATVSSRAAPGDAMTLTSSERSSIASAVWNATTRTLTSFGSLASDVATAVWSYTSRTLTSFGSLASDVANAVWSASTRTLTSFGTLVSDVANAVWTASTRTLTSFGTLANDVATAVWGYTTRTLTSFGTLTTDTANAVWGYTTRTLTSFGTLVNDVANAVWAMVIDGGKSAMGLMRLFAAALLGKVSGAQTNTPIFRDIADTKNRITMTVDNDGNRTGVTLDDS